MSSVGAVSRSGDRDTTEFVECTCDPIKTMIPVKYNLRSLWARKVGSLMTIMITSIVVMSSIFAFGLYAGLEHTLEVSSTSWCCGKDRRRRQRAR